MNSIKKILAITLAVIMSLGIVSASAFAEGETEATPEEITNEIISVVDITVAAPVEGEYAIGDYEYDSADYAVEFLEWVGFETGVIYYSTDEEAEIADEPFTAGSA